MCYDRRLSDIPKNVPFAFAINNRNTMIDDLGLRTSHDDQAKKIESTSNWNTVQCKRLKVDKETLQGEESVRV
jgi:hypothetical protein